MDKLPLTAIKGFSPSVLFSKLKPGARINPHTGLWNCRLICHLPLVVPSGRGSRVGDERRDVVRGEVWAFDDSINHEAWNNSVDDRIVLIFDVWHPDLIEQERRDITSLLAAVSVQRGAVAQFLLRFVVQQKVAICHSTGPVLRGLTSWSAVPILPRLCL